MVALTLIALVVSTLLGGLHLSGVGGLNPALRSVDGPTYVAMKQALDRSFPRLARPLMLGSLALSAATAVVAAIGGHPGVAVLGLAAVLALAVTLAAILRGDLPVNRIMATWTPTRLPEDWKSVRDRWERFFLVRVAANLLAVALLLAAAIVVR
jgi:hypothetical protein